ncbi:MAG: metallopeptidase TldD-related protein [Acidobacteriota bacterium]
MTFPRFEPSAVARALGYLPEGPGEFADGYFETLTETRLGEDGYAARSRAEEGFSLRLTSSESTYVATRDSCSEADFRSAYRQVARTLPNTPLVWREREGREVGGFEEGGLSEELTSAPRRLRRRLGERGFGLRYRATFLRHHREVLVAASEFCGRVQRETFYSVELELPGGFWGTLLPSLGEGVTESLADLAAEFARYAECRPAVVPPTTVVLGPQAAAVFLHEAVAHTLEVDTLAASGDPRAALGMALASPALTVFDDPETAPRAVRRTSDDEGMPVVRRCLLRRGAVEQLIADRFWAEKVDGLIPGAGRRADRSYLPGPRSYHLEVMPGEESPQRLLSSVAEGIYVPLFVKGQLDSVRGTCRLDAPGALQIQNGEISGRLGRCRFQAPAADLLGAVAEVASDAQVTGAGWCAKSDQRLPVWATTPTLLLDAVSARPW